VKAPAASRPREQAKQQGGGEAGSFLWFAGPAARASQVVQDDMILDLAPEKIFFDWSSNQKMRFLLSHLPASPPPCYLDRTSRPKAATEASAIPAAAWQHEI
jgi:hypothetical protein